MKKIHSGFSLVELLVTITLVAVLSTVAYLGIGTLKVGQMNKQVKNDLLAIANALEQYRRDHNQAYPVPTPGSNQNVLCFDSSGAYTHSCETAAIVQGVIDNNLLTKRYLSEVPLDPRTKSRYAYGTTNSGSYYMVAGLHEEEDGSLAALTAHNLNYEKSPYHLPSLIRSYDGPDFVLDGERFLPYNPNILEVTATLENVNGEVRAGAGANCNALNPAASGKIVYKGERICTGDGSTVDIYFSDGSFSYLENNTEIELPDLSMTRNDGGGTVSKVFLKLKVGKIWNKVVRLASESEFRVETTGMIAGVRGTEFGMQQPATGSALLTVASGAVDVSDGAGSSPILVGPTADGSPSSVTVSPEGAIIPSSSSISEPHRTSGAKLSLFHKPYLVGFTPHSNAPYDLVIAFNGSVIVEDSSSAPELLTGFEIFTKRKDATPAVTLNGSDVSFIPDHFGPGLGAYLVKLNYMKDMPANTSVILRAFVNAAEGERFSQFSSEYGLASATATNEGIFFDFRQSFASHFPSTPQPNVTSATPSPEQNCVDIGGVWKNSDNTCLSVAQAACYGDDLSSATPNNGYWDGTGCWVMGQAGQACSDPDGTGSLTGACDILDGKVAGYDASCVAGNWNDATCSVCSVIIGTSPTCNSTAATLNTAPYYFNGKCNFRDASISQDCTAYQTGLQRICQCQ